jgi:hypothetical protein
MLTWTLYGAPVGDPYRRVKRVRRVFVQDVGPLSAPQLTTLAARMAAFVLRGQPGTHHVPSGLPYREVAGMAVSVPPGGGEGGANRTPGQHRIIGRPAESKPTEGVIR